jgi:ADP-ribose pyrophosphatase
MDRQIYDGEDIDMKQVTDFTEKTVSTTSIFKGKIISLQVDEVTLPNGGTASREIVKHPGAVAVIGIVDGKLLVVEQYRKPLERLQIEIPAGKLDGNEAPELAAKRELQEETGYTCERVTHLHSMATSPGFADEIIHLYVAEGLKPGEANPDEDEFLQADAITKEQAGKEIAEGRICDAKTLLAVYAWLRYETTGVWGV